MDIFDNIIIIEGGTSNKIKKALIQWSESYSSDLKRDFTFKIYLSENNNFIIQAEETLDNTHFFFLVNYLKYPIGINYKIDIKGYTKGKENNDFSGQNLMVYISEPDTEYDNVFVVTPEDKTFKTDFGGTIESVTGTRAYEEPKVDLPDNQEIIKVGYSNVIKKATRKEIKAIEKRIKIIMAIVVILFIGTYVTYSNKATFLEYNGYIGFGLSGWFFFDYTILQKSKHYFMLLGLAFIVFVYGFYLQYTYTYLWNNGIAKLGTLSPITFLLLQKPLRFIFIALIKREPVIDNPLPSFADFVYVFIIWMSAIYFMTSFTI